MTDPQIIALIVLALAIVCFGRSCGIAFVGICGLIVGVVWLIYTFFAIFAIALFCAVLIFFMLVLSGSERQ